MKSKKSRSNFAIQCVAAAVFVIFQIFSYQYMRGFFESKLNLFLSVAFSGIYGVFVLYDYFYDSPSHEQGELMEKDSQQ